MDEGLKSVLLSEGFPDLAERIKEFRESYTDPATDVVHLTGMLKLVRILRERGRTDLVSRAISGEWLPDGHDAKVWIMSEEGQAALLYSPTPPTRTGMPPVTNKMQLDLWREGTWIHRGEPPGGICTPDRGCCHVELKASDIERERFFNSDSKISGEVWSMFESRYRELMKEKKGA